MISGRTLRRLGPASGAVQSVVPTPQPGEWALPLSGAVWVTSPAAKSLIRVDPTKRAVVAIVPVCDVKVYGLTAARGAIWAACYVEGEVVRVDSRR